MLKSVRQCFRHGKDRPVNKIVTLDHVFCAFEYRSWHSARYTLGMYLMFIRISFVVHLLSI